MVGESHDQYVRNAVEVCYRQAKEANAGHGGKPYLIENNYVDHVTDQSEDTDRDCDAACVQTDRGQLVCAE